MVVDDMDYLMTFNILLIEKIRSTTPIHFEIIKAYNGQEALIKYVENAGDVRLILMDC